MPRKRLLSYKVSKVIVHLNSTIDHPDLSDVSGTLHTAAAEHTGFSNARGMFTKIKHIQGE